LRENRQSIKNVIRQYQKTLEAEFGEIIARDSRYIGDKSAIKKDTGEIRPIKEEAEEAEKSKLEKRLKKCQ